MEKISFIFSKNILFKDKTTYTTAPGMIEIQGQFIRSVTKFNPDDDKTYHKNKEIVGRENYKDFDDLLITPAFINAHTHVAMSFFRAILAERSGATNLIQDVFFKAESRLTSADVKAFAKMGAYECLLNGIGLVWDHYYFGSAVAEALQEVGLCGVVAPTLQDLSGPGQQMWQQGLQETSDLHGNKQLKKSGIFAALGPHATDTVSSALWEKIREISAEEKLPIHVHVAQSKEEYKFSHAKYNTTPLGFLHKMQVLEKCQNILLVHGIYLDKDDYKLLHPQKHILVFCPFSQLIFQHPADIVRWEKEGKRWVVGTDCVASNDSMNIQKELKLIAGFPRLKNRNSRVSPLNDSHYLLGKVFDEPGLIHPEFQAGSLAPGALANLLVWDTKHPSLWPCRDPARALAMGDTLGAIFNMCVNGKWVGKDGNYCQSILNSNAYLDSYQEAQSRLRHLFCLKNGQEFPF